MEISSIKLVNFRQYKNVTIEFSTDKEKNITILIGDNTSGKTTIVNAFLWGLYRTNNFDDKILLNSDVADELMIEDSIETKVIVELEHKECSYTITTKEEYVKTASGVIRVKTKANTHLIKVDSEGSHIIPEIKVEDEINSILSPALKEYFFFDGENNSIESVSKKKNLTDAVSDLMGLKRFEQLREYYDPSKSDSVTSKLRAKLVSTDDGKLAFYNEQLSDAQNKIVELREELDNINSEIDTLNIQLNEKEELIDANKDVQADQENKKRLKLDIAKNTQLKEANFNSLIASLNNSNALLKVLFAKSFRENEIDSLLSKTTFKSENSLKFISEEAIDQIIKRGYCLCGTPIIDKSDVYQHLISEKEHMEPRDFGKYASDFSDSENNNFTLASSISQNISNSADALIDLITRIDANKDSLKEIEKRIAGRTDVGELQKDATQISRQISSKRGRAEYIESTAIVEKEKEVSKYQSYIDELTSKTEGNALTQRCLDYAEYIFRRSDKQIGDAKVEIRNKLEKEVNSIFQKMYHGNRVITIDPSFKADAKLIGNKDLDKSKGLETVKNFAFVTGLMKLVKEKINAKDGLEDEQTEQSYPLVLDAPFSNTDEIHINNICSVMPSYCNQIIIVVMRKDFESAKKAMVDKIGKQYNILKKDNSETESIIEEVL